MRKVWKWLALVALAAAVVGAVLYWRSRSGADETAATTTVVAAARGDLTASISPTGQVYTAHTATLGFEVTKLELVELSVAAGQEVKKGDLLARIDPSSLERAVLQAEADLADAQEALETVESPSSALDRRAADLAVTQAKTALELAKETLAEMQNPDVESAERAVRRASASLQSAKLNLALAQNSTTVNKAVRDAEYAVAWNERKVRDLEAQLGLSSTGQNDGQAGSAQGEMAIAAAARTEAGIAQGPMPGGGGKNATSLEDQLAYFRDTLADARLQLTEAGEAAAAALEDARLQVAEAEKALAEATDSLADAQSGPTALELSQAQDAVSAAEYNLAKAEQDQADRLAGPDAGQLQLAQAQVAAAQATLEDAQATLQAATLIAPFDGTVVSVGADVGDLVSAGTAVITLADLTELRVMASIDETEISRVEIGQEVVISFDAFTGFTFQGKVLEVPLQGTVSQSIVTYQVPISLEGVEGVDVKSGMTANLTIVTGQVQDALLVPSLAVQQGDSGNIVLVEDGTGGTVETPVETGVNNGTYTQIVRGLNEGDRVVVVYDTSEQDNGFGFVQGGNGLMGGGLLGDQRIRVRP
ncbi:MAG TPA: efflux RND transporter periplasmic adaptor subunit [Anaerolineae bacterium]|nr:efflux RND transporter periplasmic adaptor subunit [Anaerolineae bacterium]